MAFDKPSEGFVFKWSKEKTEEFIRLRASRDALFTGAKYSAISSWKDILEEMGLQGKVTALQAKKKWDHLKKKYKDCKYPWSGEGVGNKPAAETWPWFALMDEVLGQRHSLNSPVLIASIPEDGPGPSSAVGGQEAAAVAAAEEEEEEDERERQPVRQRRRKRERDEDLMDLMVNVMDLMREDMRQQRELEERRAERMDRLFSILEKMVQK
ncbi:testis-specific Y-encoded-like protein 2 [Austrofundulus limnaeus]|uniref:Testis-specific Y-encoded-like protein 2 n=1 Tax=Austrofundulus limnaeus TaxID=52670 RepID=A0A2I4BIR3_AUSLI|nr:PREDICTED: testis-specific Y-encoded-like protein 2 [Austrofundulus limnaeus]